MKILGGFILGLLTLVGGVQAADDCVHDSKTFKCVDYVRNYDGDTVTVDIPNVHPLFGKKVSVRVRGVDTAEVRTEDVCEKQASRTATRLVKSLLKQAKRIDLKNVERDKYFRILADVHADGESVGDILLKNKLAVEYHGGRKLKTDWCAMVGAGAAAGAAN